MTPPAAEPLPAKARAPTPQVLCRQAREWAETGQDQAALQAYAQAIDIDPEHDPAWVGQGRLLALQGDLLAGVQALRQGLRYRLKRPAGIVAIPSSTTAAKPTTAPTPAFNRPEVTACFWRTLAQLAQAGIHAFPTSGTLLGLEREHRLLPHDKDVDLAVPLQELGEAVALMTSWGWQPVPSALGLTNPVGLWQPSVRLHIDLCALMKEAGSGQTIGGFWRQEWPREWWRIVEYPMGMNLHPIDTPVGPVWYPTEPERILQAFYGADWRTPDPDFDTVIAGYNMRGFSLLSQCFALYRTYGRWEEGKLHKALATARHAQRKQPEDPLWADVVVHLNIEVHA